MKRPLYALLISPDEKQRRDIISGKITATVREGKRDYQDGPVMLCCHLEPWTVMADITSVRHMTLCGTTWEIARVAGFDCEKDLWESLCKYYPKLKVDSSVTLIHWQNVRGKLVDDYIKKQQKIRAMVDGVCDTRVNEFRQCIETGECSTELEKHFSVCDSCDTALTRAFQESITGLKQVAQFIKEERERFNKKPSN